MKNYFTTLALMLFLSIGVMQAQTLTDSWAWGFGGIYPRLYSSNTTTLNTDYGVYLSIQRTFSENVGLRLKGGYSHLEGQWRDATFAPIVTSTNLMTADLDLMYYIVPCAPVSPYLYVGLGGNYKSLTNNQTVMPDDNKFGSQLNMGVGAEFKVTPAWSIVTEFGYHVTNNSELDGTIVPSEINGRDAYLVLSAGVNFLFQKGAESKTCEPCCEGLPSGIASDMTDYNKIEDMIKRHIPKEVIKEVAVDRYIAAISDDRLVLVGVNFAFDKSDLLPESYPVLDKAVILLNERYNSNVEIQGYTDYIGTDAYNQELSVQRAVTVREYLISKGIDGNRLTTVGFGKGNPVANNDTEEGRTMNRRIVFKIVK
jgi:OOP family OmpA-OmpF porin